VARFEADIALPDVLIALAAWEQQGLLPPLRSVVQDFGRAEGLTMGRRTALASILARRPMPKPGSRHIVECAARPSNMRCGKERAARARRNKGGLRARPHATGTMRENTPFEHFQAARRQYEGRRRLRLPVQAKSLLIRAIRGNNAHRSALEPRVYFGEVSNAETGFALHSRKRRRPLAAGKRKRAAKARRKVRLFPSAPSRHGTVRSLPLRTPSQRRAPI
jgi:hypothetical protein